MHTEESSEKSENGNSGEKSNTLEYIPFKKRRFSVNSSNFVNYGTAVSTGNRGSKKLAIRPVEKGEKDEGFFGEKREEEYEEGEEDRLSRGGGSPLTQSALANSFFEHKSNAVDQIEEQEKNIIKDVAGFINFSLVPVKQRSQGVVFEKPIESIYTLPCCYRNIPESVVNAVRDILFIDVSGSDIPAPIVKFDHMKLPRAILRALNDKNILEPTKIQMQALPAALLGRDVIGISSTGSGKTIVFLIPMVMQSWEMEWRLPLRAFEGPFGLVLCPSRELASQITEVVEYFARYVRKHGGPSLECLCVIGGTDLSRQKDSLRDGVHMVVATPGRLSDLVSKGVLNLAQCRYLCFDEADRLIDLGFEEEIGIVFNQLSGQRQTLLFSATMPKKLQEFARSSLVMPIVVNVGVSGSASKNVKQLVLRVPKEQKLKNVLQSLQNTPPPVLIFCENKADVDMVHEYLLLKGVDVSAIHGGLSQEERSSAVKRFRDGERDVLVGTDVASKGLDFSAVQHVINFDLPRDIENYVHRIGRTGRGDHTGMATTLLDGTEEESVLKNLKSILIESNQDIPEFLKGIHVGADTLRDIGGLRGCAYCGALGHRIAECQKLSSERNKQLMGQRGLFAVFTKKFAENDFE
ncbi:helicase [Theileria orientalis]|uniref:RNA helicase n=1 Tax=Theileria orientalis TaxID=68886 RepID=A0A976MEN9_THEOR|nr:helicase [Theileria orientalis]